MFWQLKKKYNFGSRSILSAIHLVYKISWHGKRKSSTLITLSLSFKLFSILKYFFPLWDICFHSLQVSLSSTVQMKLTIFSACLKFINYIKFSPPDARAKLWTYSAVQYIFRGHKKMNIFDISWKILLSSTLFCFRFPISIKERKRNFLCECKKLATNSRQAKPEKSSKTIVMTNLKPRSLDKPGSETKDWVSRKLVWLKTCFQSWIGFCDRKISSWSRGVL